MKLRLAACARVMVQHASYKSAAIVTSGRLSSSAAAPQGHLRGAVTRRIDLGSHVEHPARRSEVWGGGAARGDLVAP